jgi:hypothetical protein
MWRARRAAACLPRAAGSRCGAARCTTAAATAPRCWAPLTAGQARAWCPPARTALAYALRSGEPPRQLSDQGPLQIRLDRARVWTRRTGPRQPCTAAARLTQRAEQARHGRAVRTQGGRGCAGGALLEACQVSRNGAGGVLCRGGAAPRVLGCSVRGNAGWGLTVKDGGGEFAGNSIAGAPHLNPCRTLAHARMLTCPLRVAVCVDKRQHQAHTAERLHQAASAVVRTRMATARGSFDHAYSAQAMREGASCSARMQRWTPVTLRAPIASIARSSWSEGQASNGLPSNGARRTSTAHADEQHS